MSEPKAHHYLPQFYLRRWAGVDGKVCRYSKPHGPEVKTKRIAPAGTGFETGLYKVRDESAPFENQMEKDFFSRIDSEAALSLQQIEQGIRYDQWTSPRRSAWSRFLLAQMLRAPEDVEQAKVSASALGPRERAEFEPLYAKLRTDADPPTVDEYMSRLPDRQIDHLAFMMMREQINGSLAVGEAINNLLWHAIRFPDDCPALLTSDRAIWPTLPLTEEDAFILLPVGPRLLFVATKSKRTMVSFGMRERADLAEVVNLHTTQHAVRAVYGVNDERLEFVAQNMATRRFSTVAERLAALQQLPFADPNLPRP